MVTRFTGVAVDLDQGVGGEDVEVRARDGSSASAASRSGRNTSSASRIATNSPVAAAAAAFFADASPPFAFVIRRIRSAYGRERSREVVG